MTVSSSGSNDRLQIVGVAASKAVSFQARHLGLRIDAAGLDEADNSIPEMRFILQEAGIEMKVISEPSIGKVGLPATFALRRGGWITVLARDADVITVVDSDMSGHTLSLSYASLRQEYAGSALVIRKSMDRIADEQMVVRPEKHWFWSRITSRSVPIGNILVASLFANLLATVASLFALQVYDRVIPNQSEDTLVVLLLGVAAALVLEALLRIARANVLDLAGREVDIEASADLLRKLMQLKIGSDAPRASRMSQLMREFASLREFITEAAVGALADIPFTFLFLLMIYWIAGVVVFVPAVAILLMVIPPMLAKKRMLRIAGQSLGAQTASGRIINEVAYGLETVKLARAERFFSAQWDETSRLIAGAAEEQRRLSVKLTQWAASVQQGAHALTVTACVYQVFAGNMTVGAIIATTLLMSRALSPMARFSTVLMRWHQVKTSLDGLDTIANGVSDTPADAAKLPRSSRPGTLAIENVAFSFEKDMPPVIQIPSLTIKAGERIAILGQNGSGKSTLLRCLAGLHSPDAGRVSVDGMDLRQIDTRDLRRAIGYLPQDTLLFNGTLRDNLIFRRSDIGDEYLVAALQKTGLGTYIQSHPSGLDMRIHDGGAGLSVGQRQSVGLARLILADHGNVLLDEPTASLDTAIEASVIERLSEWIEGRTFIVATHRVPILRLVSRVVVMHRGRVVIDGPRDEVMKRINASQNSIDASSRAPSSLKKVSNIRQSEENARS